MVRNVLSKIAPLALGAAAVAALIAQPRHAKADGDAVFAHERCATRLSVALIGKSATPELLVSADPQSAVDAMLADAAFAERFARFANSQFNPDPGVDATEDASYTLAKYILSNGKPWHEMFDGQYDV